MVILFPSLGSLGLGSAPLEDHGTVGLSVPARGEADALDEVLSAPGHEQASDGVGVCWSVLAHEVSEVVGGEGFAQVREVSHGVFCGGLPALGRGFMVDEVAERCGAFSHWVPSSP